jgi:hypothetical protein
MSHCKLRTPSPIHFKLRIVIGIDSLYWFLKKCCFQLYKYCINVPIHVYGAAVGEIKIFHSRVMGKKAFTNIVWMLMTGVSCALGAAVYFQVPTWTMILHKIENDVHAEHNFRKLIVVNHLDTRSMIKQLGLDRVQFF